MEDKKEDEKEKKIPEVRFKGFTDEWETKKLGEIAEIIGGGTPNTNNPDYWDGDIDWYAPAEINEQNYVDSSERKITRLGLEKSSAKILPADKTILFTSRAGIGKTAILKSPGATNQGFQSLVLNDDNNPYFVYSMSDIIKKKAEKIASGSTFAEISGKMLASLEFRFPLKAEQEKIGEYFKSLDKLIGLHQRKCEKLEKMKKAMLQKMFPCEGVKVPEIRFKGFTGDWEERKVDDLANRYDNLRVPVVANLRIPGSTPYYGANGIQDYVDGFTHEGEFVLVAEDGASDLKNYPVQCVNGRIWVNNHAHVLQGKENIADNKFLSYALHCADIESLLVGGGRAKLNAEIMMGIVLQIPELAEQQKIGEYFANLDKLITLQKKKCETLRNTKKAMLEKMFV